MQTDVDIYAKDGYKKGENKNARARIKIYWKYS